MNIFDDITVISLEMALLVQLERGDTMDINRRPWQGLSFAESGKIIYRQNGKEFISDQQHAVLLPKDTTYTLDCRESGRFPVINFLCDESFAPKEIISIEIPGSYYFFRQCEKLRRLIVIGSASSRAKCLSLLYDIVAQLAEINGLSSYAPVLRPAITYLEKNYTDPKICNEILAKESGISEVYLRKLFKNSYGVSPGQYIQSLRINYAKDLLTAGESVSNTAALSGYTNPYHFCRIFKEKVGLTPTEYKRSNSINGF